MGRTPQPPGLQQAMGNPGKRKSKPAPARQPKGGAVEMPHWMARGKAFAGAREHWSRLAPSLAKLNVLSPTDVDALGRYCRHLDDWVRLTKQLDTEGHTQVVNNVNGDPFIRIHPAAKLRDTAEKHLVELEDRFGLNPRERMALYRSMNAMNVPVGDLFGRDREPPQPAPEGAHDSIVGFGRRPAGGGALPN